MINFLAHALKDRFLRNVIILAFVVAVAFPLYEGLFVYPKFRTLQTEFIETDSVRMARHLMSAVGSDQRELGPELMTPVFRDEVGRIVNDFDVWKLRVFSKSGQIIYSTLPEEVGQINEHDYFHNIVARGQVFSLVVNKHEKTREGQIAALDVVEVYVPVMKEGAFLGAFEVYHNITPQKSSLDDLILAAHLRLVVIGLALLLIAFVLADRAGKDLKAREKAEKAVRDSEQRFRAVAESASDAIIVIDAVGNIVSWNEGAVDMFGLEEKEALGGSLTRIIPERFREGHEEGLQLIRETGETRPVGSTVEFLALRKDGGEFPVEISRGFWSNGEETFFTGILRDITRRKFAEDKLREREERLAEAQSLANSGSVEVDTASGIMNWSAGAYKVLDYSIEMVPSVEAILDRVHADDRERVTRTMNRFTTEQGDYEFEHRIVWSDGAERTVHTYLKSEGKTGERPVRIRWTMQDITERKRADQQLRQAQKQQSLSSLAGGITHELNNLLLPIITLTQMVFRDLPEGSPNRRKLEKVIEASNRAKDIIKQVLIFSRIERADRKDIDVADAIGEAMKLVHTATPSTIKVVETLDPEVGIAFVDAEQLQVLLVNLTSNAIDAIGRGTGEIRVSLEPCAVDVKSAESVPDLEAGDYAKLTVSDTGCGMDEEMLERIFDPFFTTKEVGEGIGMGLSMARGIVEQHGGAIDVSSTPGAGTRVEVYLPTVMKRDE